MRGGTFCAEAFEFVVGAVEGALEARFVAGEAGEGVEAGGVLDEDASEELVGGQFGFVGRGIGLVLGAEGRVSEAAEQVREGVFVVIEVGLDAGEAGQLPIGDGHLFDQGLLEAVDGAVLGAEVVEET